MENKFFLVSIVEKFLSYRKRKKYIAKEKQKRKNFIQDWGGALIWAAFVVLLINQYFFQAYKIPSSSMENTLNVGDMLFVNKSVYGPQLLPGYLKVPSPVKVKRGDIIIFESPEYKSKGVVREIFNRLVYMLTFSLVNLDRDERGAEAVHFLVKRSIGEGGDFIHYEENEMFITPYGLSTPISEKSLFAQIGAQNNTEYRVINGNGADRYLNDNFIQSYRYFTENPLEVSAPYELIYNSFNFAFFHSPTSDTPLNIQNNHSPRFMAMRDNLGFFVEANYILPLGDNRNNSHDSRSWGPVKTKNVLGKVALRYWPLNAFGTPK